MLPKSCRIEPGIFPTERWRDFEMRRKNHGPFTQREEACMHNTAKALEAAMKKGAVFQMLDNDFPRDQRRRMPIIELPIIEL